MGSTTEGEENENGSTAQETNDPVEEDMSEWTEATNVDVNGSHRRRAKRSNSGNSSSMRPKRIVSELAQSLHERERMSSSLNVAVTNDAENTEFDTNHYPMREIRWKLEDSFISFNPIASIIAIGVLWGTAIWCMLEPTESNSQLVKLRGKVTLYFTWFYMGSKAAFFFFMLYISWKFGHIKMGNKPPEFSSVSYFCMIFASGVAVGLFVFGVAEPLWHQSSHYYANAGYHTQDEVDMFAINMTVTNWAISGWTSYIVVAIAMALAGYRFNLPMTFRSCLYPVFGEYTWGWIGDILDGFTMIVIVAGVCTSLGLGAAQIVVGMQYLGWVDDKLLPDEVTRIQNVVIWGVTSISTASFLAGLRSGIRSLSFLAFMSGMLLLFLVLTMDNSKFLLNLMVQESGYYFQYSVFLLNFWTDAFAQLRPGEGRNIDGLGSEIWWMDAWMVFYQAWWVAWAPFVGIFIARISRGRTIGEITLYGLVLPTLYCIIWFCVWGGVGIRQSRQALELMKLGEDYWGNSKEFQVPGRSNCFDVPQEDTYSPNGTLVFHNYLPGVTPVCTFGKSDEAAFNVLYSFSFPTNFMGAGYGPALGTIFILSLTMYFCTSSDSGSFVVDLLSANGRMRHHWIQRLFWSLTEAAVATALLTAGGAAALRAVQAASILCGLPFCLIMWYLCHTIYLFCNHAVDYPEKKHFHHPTLPTASTFDEAPTSVRRPEFSMPVYGGIFNLIEYAFSLGRVHPRRVFLGMDLPTRFQVAEFFKALFFPYYPLCQILWAAYPLYRRTNCSAVLIHTFLFATWIALFIASYFFNKPALGYWALACFFCAGFVLAAIRNEFRFRFRNIRSDLVSDLVVGIFLWPQALVQMRLHCLELGLPRDIVDDESTVYDAFRL